MRSYRTGGRGREGGRLKERFKKIMKCLRSAEQMKAADEDFASSGSIATKDNHSAGIVSTTGSETAKKLDAGNIEEAELSLRETSSLNYEEARALLGRIEYQKGNIEAALHVFEGIDIGAITPKMKITLAGRESHNRRRPKNFASPPMSIHALSLLFEAIFLKAKSLQFLGRFQEAAETCKVILDVVEPSSHNGLFESFGSDSKLQELLSKAIELLPELWKLSDSPHEAILSYRRALLNRWNLDVETNSRIQKEFAIFLLYSGDEATPPNLRFQMDSPFVPRNNLEEAILLLMILLRKVNMKKIEWDSSILEHLTFALSSSGDTRALAEQVEGLLPEILGRKETYRMLALCYHGAGESLVALDLLRKLLSNGEDPNCVPCLLMASKICGESPTLAEEGVGYAHRALENLQGECDQLKGKANHVLGVSLSARSRSAITDSETVMWQSKALQALETAAKATEMGDVDVIHDLALEYAEQRKLDAALGCAKSMIKLEGGSNVKGWILLARILSAQKRFTDAETIISAALDQTVKWDQGELLRLKAKLHMAQGHLKSAIDTYTQLLALLQVQSKSFSSGKKVYKGRESLPKNLELETWHDLAYIYINLSQWRDAEVCLSRSRAITPYSAARCHVTGVLYKGKGQSKEALKAFLSALDIDPTHVPSMVSTAEVLQELGVQPNSVVRSFLMEALRLDRSNPAAWYNLGLLYKAEGSDLSMQEAAECFQAAALLEESTPIEPFR